MGFFDNILFHVDEGISGLFGQWNLYSTGLVTVLIGLLSYQIYAGRDADIHPMLLARQAQSSPVRQQGESAVYRCQAAPHGMSLNSGLNVKDPGAAKWTRGRDGDLRDIWRQAMAGVKDDVPTKGQTGRILTVLGREKVVEHKLADVTRQINLIGQSIRDQGGNRVAIYLPNSVELMASLFACAFYNMTAIMLPFDQADDVLISMLRRAAADTVITAPGSLTFDMVAKSYPALRQLVWVVDEGNKHMDWNEVPEGMGGSVNVSTWQDIVNEQAVAAGRDLPPLEGQSEARDVIVFWQSKTGTAEEMACFTAANLVAAVSAQLLAIPTAERMGPSDLFLPADSLANTHTLALTLAALYANASVAFNSVAAQAPDLTVTTTGISPTIVVATPAALLKTHEQARGAMDSVVARQIHRLQTQNLTQAGVMPTASSLLSRLIEGLRPATGNTPGKLRLVYTAERVGAGTPPLSAAVLSDLRVYLAARVMYALTAAKVAGAATQTGFFDYRVSDGERYSHFGPPLTCTEILLRDTEEHKTTDEQSIGEIIVRGPSVAAGEAALGVAGVIRDDNTLAYANNGS